MQLTNINGETRHMKTTIISAALTGAITALVTLPAAHATQPASRGLGAATIASAVSGKFSTGSNGTSASYAQNSESATASVTASRSHAPDYRAVNAGISGATRTDSHGIAFNVSTGAGTGSATSSGFADTSVKGATAIAGVTGAANGGAGTRTTNLIQAGSNQGSYVEGSTLSGFDAQLNYSRSVTVTPPHNGMAGGTRSATTSLHSQTTGYASGANATGALESLNAAGIANIGASGYFFGKTHLSAQSGAVTAP
jgi:hypothetical protein